MKESVENITVRTVFRVTGKDEIWCEVRKSLLDNLAPLKTGYKTVAFIRSSKGCRERIDASELPDLTADVYIDDELYGNVRIKKTYEESLVEEPLRIIPEREPIIARPVRNNVMCVGASVVHKIFGSGTVTSMDERYITVKFGAVGEKKFAYPASVRQGFIRLQ